MTGRLVRRVEENAFNQEFWASQDAEAKFAAAWEMVVEVELFRGQSMEQLRMRRDVAKLIRRSR
ncbi:MAG: hypothetical protein ACR2IE_13705 [Candidatus Sumerlaeaceae bacterium]